MTENGATFCHVKIINISGYFSPSITGGIQKWKGAIPDLIIILIMIKVVIKFSIELVEHRINAKIKIDEPNAWARKYLREASDSREFFSDMRIGIIPIRLISNPIHIPIHLVDLIVKKVPKKINVNINNFHGWISIKRGKSLFHWRDMSPLA